MQVACHGKPLRTLPWSTSDYFEMEADANSFLAQCGVPPRPPGRLWLLRSPKGFVSLDATLSWLSTSAKDAGLDILASRAFVEQIVHGLDDLFTPRA